MPFELVFILSIVGVALYAVAWFEKRNERKRSELDRQKQELDKIHKFESPCTQCGRTNVAKFVYGRERLCSFCKGEREEERRRQEDERNEARRQAQLEEKRRGEARHQERERAIRTRQGLQELSGEEFEKVVKEVFEGLGWQASLTPSSGDGGVDLVIEHYQYGKGVVQCKNWRDPVGSEVVRNLIGALVVQKRRDRSFNKAFLVTTSRFTSEASRTAEDQPIELVDGEKFLQWQAKADER